MKFLSFAPFEKIEEFCQKFLPFHGLNPSHKMDQTTTGKQPYFFAKKKSSKFFEKKYYDFFSRNFPKDVLRTLLGAQK